MAPEQMDIYREHIESRFTTHNIYKNSPHNTYKKNLKILGYRPKCKT